MHSVVRSFRTIFVEGRFVSLLAVLGMIALRFALYFAGNFPTLVSRSDNYLWKPISPLFDNPLISLTASTLSVLLIAWILFLFNSRFNLLRSRSYLPFAVPLILLSFHPVYLAFSGYYISAIFILLAFFPLLESYQKHDAYLCSFRSSILIAVASLFQIYALVLLPLWWRGEWSMRGPQFRSFVSSLFGVFLVYVSLFSFFWFFEDIPAFIAPFYCFSVISVQEIPSFSILEWSGVIFTGLFFIYNMIFSIRIYNRDKALTLTLMQFVNFLIVFLLFFQVLCWQETLFFLLLSVALISYLNAYFYSKTASKTHIYIAYGMLSLMAFFYLSFIIPSLAFF